MTYWYTGSAFFQIPQSYLFKVKRGIIFHYDDIKLFALNSLIAIHVHLPPGLSKALVDTSRFVSIFP